MRSLIASLVTKALYRVVFRPAGNGRCNIVIQKRFRWVPDLTEAPDGARWKVL